MGIKQETRKDIDTDTHTHTYSVIVARADPPLKGTRFRTEPKSECVKESEVDRQRGPGEAWSHGETLSS